jgi:hypothetical protein
MSNFMVVLLVIYVQCGLVVAWYLFHRRVLAVRDQVEADRSAREASLLEVATKLLELRRLGEEIKNGRGQGLAQRETLAFKQARRRGALEMSRRGLDSYEIAQTLNMRRAEIETLVRFEHLRRHSQAQNEEGPPHWLEPAS